MTPGRVYSDHGLALTRSFEGLRLTAYKDGGGVWTIGYGHTGADVHEGQAITELQAEWLLAGDMDAAVACVNGAVRVPLAQGQFDALVDFVFNCGAANFLHSTLLRYVNEGDFARAAEQIGLWIHAAGQVEAGLVRRRAAETAMFHGEEVQ